MLTVNVQIEVTTVGDGQNHDDVFNFLPNSNASPPSSIVFSVAGDLTVPVPINAAGMFIVAPSAAGTHKLKGTGSDTGVTIAAGGYLGIEFIAAGAVSSIVLNSTVSSAAWTVYWL